MNEEETVDYMAIIPTRQNLLSGVPHVTLKSMSKIYPEPPQPSTLCGEASLA